MELNKLFVACFLYIIGLIQLASGLSCYKCVSTEPGCGKEVNIRLQKTKGCPSRGDGGGENFCVKIIDNSRFEETITRECVSTLVQDARHRKRMPTVQRHGYCSPARNDDPWNPYEERIVYCFCNDWNGCNPASNIKAKWTILGLLVSIATAVRLLM